ncbi:GTHB1 protein, partial [Atractosteus spatula]|nr:GTHB1 protein [Atractosteus spatula]
MSPVALCLATLCWAALRCRADCGLANISIPVENEECSSCIIVNTTSCAGSCPTQDPVYKSFLALHIQHSCNYKEFAYETIALPSCPGGTESLFTYPVAMSCECAPCKSDVADCGVPGSDYLSCQVN